MERSGDPCVTIMQECKNKITKKEARMKECQNTKMQENKNARTQDYRIANARLKEITKNDNKKQIRQKQNNLQKLQTYFFQLSKFLEGL